MLRDVAAYLYGRIRQRGDLIPLGYSWTFAIVVDVAMAFIVTVATLQRPHVDLAMCLLAIAITVFPDLALFFSDIAFKPWTLWLTSMASVAIFLFATSTPIHSDFAPLLLVLMVSAAVSMSQLLFGVIAASSAALLLVAAAQEHRLENLALYLPVLGMGWVVGFLMQTQRNLMIKQEEAQAALAEHAVTDERRRIAREVHDVIAHSLSITLLHLTGARRELQEDGDVPEAIAALRQAEQLGRQAMADIRRTVGLLDAGPMNTAPEPGVEDIADLVDDFHTAGLDVTLLTTGSAKNVSGAVGLALYRITQESLANVAKHAPDSKCAVRLDISRRSADLAVTNQLPVVVHASRSPSAAGRGVEGMRQRVQILGGIIEVGAFDDQWSVRASIPLEENGSPRPPWCKV
ncbi:MAG TPA: histidine kinase [Mycobacterium sp.]|nr:histidine kinase [Mycobacterium sp.]